MGLIVMAAIWAATTATMLDRSRLHAAPAPVAPIARQSPLLPEGYGKATVERLCLGCHEADRMVYLRETEEGWTAIVNSMRARGATGTEEEFQEVVAYLAWFFGPEPPPPATPAVEEASSAAADSDAGATPATHATVELVSEMTKVAPGGRVALGLRFALDDGWRLAGKNGGVSAPRVSWTTPTGLSLGEIQWPAPVAGTAASSPAGAGDVVLLLVPADVAASAATGSMLDVQAEVTYLVCSDVCRDESASAALQLPVGPGGTAQRSAEFDRARAALPPVK